MGILNKLFGGGAGESSTQQDDFTSASWIASLIDGVINTQGFSELEKSNTAIVMDNDNKFHMAWNSTLEIGGKIKSFVYLKEIHEYEGLKSAFGFDLVENLPPKEAIEMLQLMGSSLGQQAVDRLAISALHELKAKTIS